MDPEFTSQEPDEARAPKRARLDGALEVTEEINQEMVDDDGWDDIYAKSEQAAALADAAKEDKPVVTEGQDITLNGEGDANHDNLSDSSIPNAPTQAPQDQAVVLVEEKKHTDPIDGPAAAMTEELSAVNGDPNAKIEGLEDDNDDYEPPEPLINTAKENAPHPNSGGQEKVETAEKVTEDGEFMAAAAAQKDNANAEWQFDSSDAESSSDSDTSSSDDTDSDDGSEDGYEMLDPATAAKILMSGDGDDDDGKKQGGDHRPRTQNEAKEEVVPKPDVEITPEMKLTELGQIQALVENMALIKANTSGEYRVLESGSVLCNEQREVVGAVLETFGRVQEPMYSVQFTNKAESDALGMEHGAKVFYVDQHSTFVFTQPLRNLKGTDASNLYDEEVGDEEIEFSDDEAEAEYKRQKKLAKRGGRGGANAQGRGGYRSFGAPGHDSGMTYAPRGDAPRQNYGGLSYDDEPQEDFYQPLKRPDNLSQLMAGNAPPRPEGNFDRGRGRGRGDRGRGRGRGRGGFDNHRGGRGGQHRGPAQSYPDQHNQSSSPPRANYQPVGNQQPPQAPSYQFNGYTFQYGNPPPQPPDPQQQAYQQPPQQSYYPPHQPAHVNPAYYAQPWGQQQPNQDINLENVLRQMGAVPPPPPPPPHP